MAVKTSVTELEDNKVKLSVEVDEQEFESALDAAFRKIAREVRIPGFRPGKAPRRLLEARLGEGVARGEALRDAIPDYYAKAVREHDVDVIAAPEIDITDGEEQGPIAFDAVVEVRPVVTVPGYESLRVTLPRPAATDEEIDAQIDRMRRQYAELETVERPAAEGDVVTIDVEGCPGRRGPRRAHRRGLLLRGRQRPASCPSSTRRSSAPAPATRCRSTPTTPIPTRRACTSRSPSKRCASASCPSRPTSGRPRPPSSRRWPSCATT